MISTLNGLKKEDYQLLIEAIPMIAILIAGADNDIDLKEKNVAEKIIKVRSYNNHFDLKSYYKHIDEQFKDLFDKFLNELPKNADSRSRELTKRLSMINEVFAKVNMRTAYQLYTSFLTYAEQIARSSGGILKLMAISKEESMWIGLPMIDPIFFDEVDEEE